ncbi:Extradiol ring-cleavage dioxygenase, class III enzyme, subunit B [Apodospora peruviana]|uniref:Extradiol ring-cleavage dioxygenase, class III enzyme, subunit B n=1 Tax=Apodospora peruviana TaxID=516989 RepID=A0AAE0ITT5_9PEZI|nr:Extradiol ring-cleavage dioxygenase, class III enzyme, subunit B [Apodospora peruviana]
MSISLLFRHFSFFIALPVLIFIVAFLLTNPSPLLARSLPSSLARFFSQNTSKITTSTEAQSAAVNMTKTPVYFFSHGGPNVQYETKHPVYPVLQAIGKEITQNVKPKAVVVFSAHWQSSPNEIHLNNAEDTDLIYDFYGFPAKYYQATFPSKGSPELASRILTLLKSANIPARGLKRGLDHGVFSGFNVAFSPDSNPLNCPLVQVSLFENEDPDAHYRLGQAVSPLRDEGIVIICTGMTVHNLRDFRLAMAQPLGKPLPYAVSFDNALKEAVESPVDVRQTKMAEVTKRPDARQAHPWMDHLMPVYIAAGAAGDDLGKQTWTMPEGSMAWAQYRFGDVPSS